MAYIKIDNQAFEVDAGTSVLEAAESHGIKIPHYCYHPALDAVGSCRMCLVEIEGIPKLQASCNTPIREVPHDCRINGKYDMVVHTRSDIVKKERENILEFLLLNHPLDCPVCDQAGECLLQDYSFRYGRAHSRFEEDKRVQPNEYLGSMIVINHNRCIMCTRCIRFTRQISGTHELFVDKRGYNSKIAILEDYPLDNLLAGNVADICPLGALLDRDYIHKNRIWNLTTQSSLCTECSIGCNINIYYQGNQIFRVSPRENLKVNGYFVCDIGRYGFHKYEDVERITSPLVKKNGKFSEISWEGAFKEIFDNFAKGKEKYLIAGIASPFHTNETNFMFGKLMSQILKGRTVVGILPPIEVEEDISYASGFRISRDRSPNHQGVVDLCLDLEVNILEVVRDKKIKLMYMLDDGVERRIEDSWIEIFRNLHFMVVQAYALTPLAQLAHLVLPGPAPFEREGTLTNDQGRVQWLRPSLPLKGKTRPDWEILMEVMNTVGKRELRYSGVSDVIRKMGDEFPAYTGMSFFHLGDYGLPKNGQIKDE